MGINIDDRFGRLVVVKFVDKNKHGRRVFECICDCGHTKQITDANLRNSTKSCGCLKKELIIQIHSIDPEIKKRNKKDTDRRVAENAKKKNPEIFLEKNRIRTRRYRAKHKEKLSQKHKDRLISDPTYLIKRNLRNRFKQAIKNNYKAGSAVKLLGIDVESFKKYLEGFFKPGMAWSNYGKWHIDHIFPLSGGDLGDINFLKKVCHYTNLQPLWAGENLSKGNKI
jgi:hypothetical protein